jgi:hypothetical protein
LVLHGNSLETNGSAVSRTCGISTRSSPARPSQASNSSSDRALDDQPRTATPTASSSSIRSSITADGGTVRLTA